MGGQLNLEALFSRAARMEAAFLLQPFCLKRCYMCKLNNTKIPEKEI